MIQAGVPTGTAEVFDDYQQARTAIEASPLPVAIKADGLASGKGVVVAATRDDALVALNACMSERIFGDSGDRVLVEEYLEGPEVSAFAFVNGCDVSSLVAACDYKRVGDGDIGPNTGGMGAYSPPSASIWDRKAADLVRTRVFEPVAAALADEGSPYIGVLYGGLMLTADGPKVIEFNCRMGDPETQVILPRLKGDLLEIMLKTAAGEVPRLTLQWDARPYVGVVMASDGYPGSYSTGHRIDGLETLDGDVTVFHAGTASNDDGAVETTGGRVVTIVAPADTHREARDKAYANAERVVFEGSFYRTDIAANV